MIYDNLSQVVKILGNNPLKLVQGTQHDLVCYKSQSPLTYIIELVLKVLLLYVTDDSRVDLDIGA